VVPAGSTRRFAVLTAALLLAAESFPVHEAAAQSTTRRLTTIAALRQFPAFYHLQNVVLRGELTDDAQRLVLRADEQQIRVTLEEGVSNTNGSVEVRGQMIDIGKLDPGDPRAGPFAEARDAEKWPRPGEELVVRLTEVRTADATTALSVRALALEPWRYEGQKVTVVGNFRGRNLFGDLPGSPGKSRYDFVIRGAEGAVWVTGQRPRGRGFDLDVDRRLDSDRWLEVSGTIVHERGLVRIEAGQLTAAKAPAAAEPPEEPAAPAPPPPPIEVVFSSPTPDETDVRPASPVRIQFSRGLDPKSVAGAFRVAYLGPPLPDAAAGGAAAPPAFETTYDPANRAITLRFKEPLQRFRTVRVEVLDVLKAFDGAPAKPWTLTFSVGG
jgi:hypothetical protein